MNILKGGKTMRARLIVTRPAYKNESRRPLFVAAGEVVDIIGNMNDRMIAEYKGWRLNVGQDEAEVLED